MKSYKPVSYRLSTELYERIMKHAEENGMTMTGIIRMALEKYFKDGKDDR